MLAHTHRWRRERSGIAYAEVGHKGKGCRLKFRRYAQTKKNGGETFLRQAGVGARFSSDTEGRVQGLPG